MQLSRYVRIEPIDIQRVDTVVAADVGYKGSRGVGVAVAYSVHVKRELCHVAIAADVDIPYVPGLLAFREAPLMITAIKELLDRCTEADVLMINGHGVSHPRRFGIASHVGVVLDKPSIGIAKKILYGSVVKIDKENRSLLVVNGSVVGFVLENAYGGKIYVSVGHRVSPEDALKIVEKVWSRDKTLPDPLFIADKLTKKLRNKL
uniref:Endonuclease V n=1 Tax=Ignisphaera aggregans TaxID=334771 RepID=A0A7C2ZV89_9CREN